MAAYTWTTFPSSGSANFETTARAALEQWRSNADDLESKLGSIADGTIDAANITVGTGKTLNVSAGTLTLADNQISGDKVEGGTINAVTVNTLTSTTVNATTVDTNVAAAGVTLAGVTLSADGTDANININITPKGTGEVNLTKVDIDAGTIDGATIATSNITVGSGKTLDVSAGTLTLADNQIPGAKVAAATAITEGVVELATNAEVLTGTDTTRAVTPAGLGYAIGRDIVYGVMWNTAASSPTLTKGLVIGGNWIAETFTSYPIQSMMKRCVLNSSAVKLYDLDAADSINKVNQAPTITGTADGTTANKLVNSAETFVTKGVVAGQWVKNTTDSTRALITAVDSETTLSLSHDIFVSGEGYAIGTANPQVDGCVMVEVPAFHYIWVDDGTNTYILQSRAPFIFRKPSNGAIIVSQLHPWFMEDGVVKEQKYFSAFESIWYKSATSAYSDHDGSTVGVSGDKAVSLPGYRPLTNQFRRNATAYTGFAGLHAAFGSNFISNGFYAYEAIWILMTVEYGSLNGQTYLPGYTNANAWAYANTRKTGRTMGLGNTSGSITVALSGLDADLTGILTAGNAVANSYRGIENIYGHIWKWLDGLNSLWVGSAQPMTSCKIYLSNNPSQWVEDAATNYDELGLSFPLSNGYTSALHPGKLLPKTATGDSATYLCDYFYAPSSAGWRGLLSGGALSRAASAGPGHLTSDYSGSASRSAAFGGRAAAK
jgi:hypothetical protein